MDERWIILLNYWQNHEFRHSLTFPFLIGALRTPIGVNHIADNDTQNELKCLIDTMRSHVADEHYYNIYRCPDLGQIVVRKVVNSTPSVSAIAINSLNLSAQPSLYITDDLQLGCTEPFDSLVDLIWKEVGSDIDNGNFSCRGKVFDKFSEYDLKIINNALA